MKTIEIEDKDFDYLKSQAIPFEDTPATVVARIFAAFRTSNGWASTDGANSLQQSEAAGVDVRFGLSDMPNVSFTTVRSAQINGKQARSKYWNDILDELLELLADRLEVTELRALTGLQVRPGVHHENGYRYNVKANVSFQGVDANRACKAISALSAKWHVPVRIEVEWQDNPKAHFAGKRGTIVLP